MDSLLHLKKLSTKDYNYHLPDELIAYFPLDNRDQSKLLVYKNRQIIDDTFVNILDHIDTNTTMIFNESKVINARLKFYKDTGAIIEIFCIKPYELSENKMESILNMQGQCMWQCLVGGKKKWKNREEPIYIDINNKTTLKAYWQKDIEDTTIIKFEWNGENTFNEILIQYGHTPLPPYIKRNDEESDKDRYQTVFGVNYGSVAAPTASLHYTDHIFQKIHKKNISTAQLTLHVGAGTFLPMKDEWIHQHTMHEEIIECSVKNLSAIIDSLENGKKILAVGTTATRTLESLFWLGVKIIKEIDINWEGVGVKQWEAYEIDTENITSIQALKAIQQYLINNNKDKIVTQTQIFIVPGYQFRIVDILQTNFHQPESTLLMLVSAFLGYNNIKDIYQHAVNHQYRFLSYGDCNLLFK